MEAEFFWLSTFTEICRSNSTHPIASGTAFADTVHSSHEPFPFAHLPVRCPGSPPEWPHCPDRGYNAPRARHAGVGHRPTRHHAGSAVLWRCAVGRTRQPPPVSRGRISPQRPHQALSNQVPWHRALPPAVGDRAAASATFRGSLCRALCELRPASGLHHPAESPPAAPVMRSSPVARVLQMPPSSGTTTSIQHAATPPTRGCGSAHACCIAPAPADARRIPCSPPRQPRNLSGLRRRSIERPAPCPPHPRSPQASRSSDPC